MNKPPTIADFNLTEEELQIVQNNLLICEFMGESYSVYPHKIPANNKRGWKYSFKWDGEAKRYEWHQLKFHESYDWLIPVVREIIEYSGVSDSAMKFEKMPIIIVHSILYKRVVEWVTDNQKIWRK